MIASTAFWPGLKIPAIGDNRFRTVLISDASISLHRIAPAIATDWAMRTGELYDHHILGVTDNDIPAEIIGRETSIKPRSTSQFACRVYFVSLKENRCAANVNFRILTKIGEMGNRTRNL